MKKLLSVLLATVMAVAITTTVSAAPGDYGWTPTGDGHTELVYYNYNDPEYSLSIPAYMNLNAGKNEITLSLTNAANFYGGKVSVTMDETKPDGKAMALTRVTYQRYGQEWLWGWSADFMYYDITTYNGTEIISTRKPSTTGDPLLYLGAELVAFEADGDVSFTLDLDVDSAGDKDGIYAGFMTYGIEFIPAL